MSMQVKTTATVLKQKELNEKQNRPPGKKEWTEAILLRPQKDEYEKMDVEDIDKWHIL